MPLAQNVRSSILPSSVPREILVAHVKCLVVLCESNIDEHCGQYLLFYLAILRYEESAAK